MHTRHIARRRHVSAYFSSIVRSHRSSSISSIYLRTSQNKPASLPYQQHQASARVHSSFAGTTSAIVIATSIAIVSSIYYLGKYDNEGGKEIDITADPSLEEPAVMAGSPLPGRPGNLTAEQEVKLREMWAALLKVFGIPALDDATSTNGTEALEQAEQRSNAGTDDKKKKKSIFSRKRQGKDASEDRETSSAVDGDDKYGQTKEFHKILESQSPESIRQAFWSMVKLDNPDGLLLRFLRARKWNVENAMIMLVATMQWRKDEVHVDDDIIRRGEAGAVEDSKSSDAKVKKEGEDFLAQMRLGKSFLHGTDREGRPMCFVRVRLHKQGEQSEPSLERYTVYTIETARYLLTSNVDTAAIVFDMTDFSLANMDYAPVKFMIKCFEANYPESLGAVLVHKSPWIFHSIWKIIKGWLDPVVASKVHFTKTLEELEGFVEKSHIPKDLGGTDDWTYHFVEPVPGENKLQLEDATKQRLLEERAAVVRDYEKTTQQWIRDPTTQEALRSRRDELTKQLRAGYWEMDPYIRARSLYDRTGMIQEGGKIQYYGVPEKKEPTLSPTGAPASNGPVGAEHRPDDLD